MDLDLDPREVLEHLNALGYSNVTKNQLKEFIKDLKKLMKYDAIKNAKQAHFEESANSISDAAPFEYNKYKNREVSSSVSTASEVDSIISDKENAKCCRNCPRMKTADSCCRGCPKAKNACKDCPGRKDPGDFCCQNGKKSQSNCQTNFTLIPKEKQGSTKSSALSVGSVGSTNTCSSYSKGDVKKEVVRQFSSFIRPNSSSSRQGKSDPVSLYHHYQSLWSQQNLPGENPHSDLRWRIRHKMMGPNPSKILDEKKSKTVPDHPPWVDP